MNPRVIWANLIVSIKSFYREKAALFFTIAFPILLILLFGLIFMNVDDVSFELYVQDADQTNTSAEFVKNLELNGTFTIKLIDPKVNATQYAKDEKINLVLVIPKGYEESLINRTVFGDRNATVTVTFIYDQSSNSASTKMQILKSVFSSLNQKMSGTPGFIESNEVSILSKKYRFIEFFVPGIIAMSVMTSSLFGTVNMNAELRQKGVLRKLSTTPITRAEWILSNIFYQMILAVISTVSILLVAYAVFNVSVDLNFWLPLFIILDVFSFAGIGMILTRFAREAESAYAAANAIMFPMMFLSGSFFQLEMMPDFLQQFARVLPLYYINEGLRTSMVFHDDMLTLYYAMIIGVFAVIVFLAGIITTGWKEDK